MTALSLNKVSKKYISAGTPALRDFSLTVNTGEIHAIVGESGCGKTTLLRLIAGLESQESGEIFVNDKLVSGKNEFVPPEKRNIGFVFQDYALFPHLNVKNNIGFGLSKLSSEEKTGRVKKYLELTGMTGYESRYPYELSGGQQQRISIARSLATEPSILLLDEPFSNLDEILKKQMRYEVKNIIAKSGTTAVFVTHDTGDALAIANNISVLRQGMLLQSGSSESIYNKPYNEYVAQMFGSTNIIKGLYNNGYLNKETIRVPLKESLNDNSRVIISVRPENIKIAGSGNIKGRVKGTVFAGNRKEVIVEVDGFNFIISASSDSNFEKGENISFSIEKYSIINPG